MRIFEIIICIVFINLLFFSCTNINEPEETPTPTPEPLAITLAEYQSFETSGASDWEYFSFNDTHFLAVAHYSNDSTVNIDSEIYKWNGFSFVVHQSIATQGARDVEYFTIEGAHYLVIANSYNNSTYALNSVVYKWDSETEEFIFYQNIPTVGAHDFEYFTIGTDYYLVTANYYNGTTHMINSEILKWNGAFFSSYQTIATIGAYAWKYFTIENSHYLAVAHCYNDTTYNINSGIFQWDSGNLSFVKIQDIATSGNTDWEFFSIDNNYYLAAANSNNDTTTNVYSQIYKWDNTLQNFLSDQPILTRGAMDWAFFTLEETPFLACANNNNDTVYDISSQVYRWDSVNEEFVSHYSFDTHGPSDLEYFIIADEPYMAAAYYENGTTQNLLSMVFKILY